MSARYERQQDLVPESARSTDVCIIGVGAIGRPLALQLASIGVERIQLFDPDTVEEVNIPTQGYLEADIGQRKAVVCAQSIAAINSNANVSVHACRFLDSLYTANGVVFCAVDSIETRSAIWYDLRNRVRFWIDTRMLGETIRVLSVNPQSMASFEAYGDTLFTAEETQPGRCTARSTIYAATIAAGLAVHQFTRFLRGYPTDDDITLNLLSSELTIGNPETLQQAAGGNEQPGRGHRRRERRHGRAVEAASAIANALVASMTT